MKMNWICSVIVLGLIFSSIQTHGQKETALSGAEGWIPNLGQIHNQRYELNIDVTHLWASGRGMNVQLRRDGLSYDTYSRNESELHFHRLDMTLGGASPETVVSESESMGARLNFYNGLKSSGASTAQFRQVTLNNVYEGVDMVCSVIEEDDAGVKYDFVLHPGANLEQIRMEYRGFDGFEVKDDKIVFELSGKTLVESIPESWIAPTRMNATVKYKIIEQSNELLVVGFEWENPSELQPEETLVIDPIPVLHWATYYGDTLPDAGTAIVTDTIGKAYLAGHTQSLLTIATDGAHQQTYAGGGADAYIAKFGAHGDRVWSTYFGGTGDDRATGVAVDGLFELYLVGNTTSMDDSLATDSAFQQTNAGGTDAFIAKFDSTGVLLWSTFLGGSGNDTASACVADTSGNLYVSGFSETGDWLDNPQFPYASGLDAFVARIDADGVVSWSTYYGGPDDDRATDIAVDSLDYVFITGSTFSDEGIATEGSHQSTLAGEEDAFAVCFNPDGSRKWGTYFGGSEKDVANGIDVYYEATYVTGYTRSDSGIADTLSFQPDYSGGDDAFLLRLDTLGNLSWSTYFGDTLHEKSNGVSVDRDGFVYMAGVTNSENSLSTLGVHQDWLRGDYEGFIAQFDSTGHPTWGTYYGGFNYDEILAIDVFGVTAIYITGFTFSEYFVAYYGMDIEYSGNTDGYLSRLDTDRITDPSGICAGGSGGEVIDEFVMCTQDSLQFSIVGGATDPNSHWVWYREGCGGDGIFEAIGGSVWLSPDSTTTYYVRGESGSYYGNCKDITIIVVEPPVAEITVNDTSLCAGDSLFLSAPSGEYYNYSWSGSLNFSSTEQNPIIDSLTTDHSGWYTLEIVNAPDCHDTDSIWVEVLGYPAYTTSFEQPTCVGSTDGSVSIDPADTFEVSIEWLDMADTAFTVSGLGVGTYTALIHGSGLCSSAATFELVAPPSPVDSLMVSSTTCGEDNGAIQVLLSDSAGNYSFNWHPDVSQSASADNLPAGDYEITVGDSAGCTYASLVSIPGSEGITADWINAEDVSCPGGSDGYLEVAATTGIEPLHYEWSTGDTATTAVDSLAAGNYSVTITDSIGCTVSLSDSISEPDLPTISADITPEICENAQGEIALESTSGGPLQFIWDFNQDTTALLQNLTAGTYTAQVSDSAGCSFSETYVVPAAGELAVQITPDLVNLFQGDSMTVVAEVTPDTMEVSYSWEPSAGLSCSDCPNPVVSPDTTASYLLTVISEEGCEATAELLVSIEKLCAEFFVPTIFSPNGDGLNDKWCAFGDCIQELQIQVFNRWGELVFESTDQENCWDGDFNGERLPSGAFVFTARAVLENGETITESGNLTIRR